MDSRTRPRQGHSLRGQLHRLAVAEAETAGAGRPRGRRPPAHPGAREGVDRGLAESTPGQIQGTLRALRRTFKAGQREADPGRANYHTGGRAPRPERGRFRRPDQRLWRPASDRRPHLQIAARRHRRRDRPQRRRQDHAVPDDHKQETPDKGTITVGESVHLGYVDQSRDSLDGKKSVWEEISGGNELILLGKREVNSRGYCSSFNFKGADQQKKVGALSGGERNRVHLAKMLKSGANVLLLDEPTNDLDVDTLR